MIEEYFKFILGDDIWGWGVAISAILSVGIPFYVIGYLINYGVEAMRLCHRVKETEECTARLHNRISALEKLRE